MKISRKIRQKKRIRNGGTRKGTEETSKKEVIYSDENGTNSIVTEQIINPEIKGAIVTAQGASNAEIKKNIISAVEAVTGLATYKIQVFEMNN